MPEIRSVAVEAESAVNIRRPHIWTVTGTHIGVTSVNGHISAVIDIYISSASVYVAIIAVSVHIPISVSSLHIRGAGSVSTIGGTIFYTIRTVARPVVVSVVVPVGCAICRSVVRPIAGLWLVVTAVGRALVATIYGRLPVGG
jgi:hypothetical protein